MLLLPRTVVVSVGYFTSEQTAVRQRRASSENIDGMVQVGRLIILFYAYLTKCFCC